MNYIKLISNLGRDLAAARDLLANVQKMHDNPKFQTLLDSDPDLKAESAKISQDARTISESLK